MKYQRKGRAKPHLVSREQAKLLFLEQKKHCSACKIIKPHSEYSNAKETWDKKRSRCKACEHKLELERYLTKGGKEKDLKRRLKSPERYMLYATKCRARINNIEFNLTLDDIKIPEFCPVFGIKLERQSVKQGPASPSLDRFDNNKGYVSGNVNVISWKANSMKRQSSIEELEKLLTWMKRKQN